MLNLRKCRVGIVGLGYVGLPLAVEFGKHFDTVGFDVNPRRIAELKAYRDSTLEISKSEFKESKGLTVSSTLAALKRCRVFIVTVPTPIDNYKRPELTPLIRASESVGEVLKKGDVVVYESTVYPGCTEEICVPILERVSGLKFNRDFFAGYSPERINPGDKEHRLTTIRKVTSGSTPQAADFVDKLYGTVIKAGTYRASSIQVAEAAKVIENTQRDVNIALINELALIFNRLGLDTEEVLKAAGTKWNFLPFRPGLVGGHCIGVDPYYLTHKAQEVGYNPEMILAGRRLNDNMGIYVAGEIVKLMTQRRIHVKGARVLMLGATFKENCPDIRNSKVFDVVRELRKYGALVDVYDPWADGAECKREYGIRPLRSPGGRAIRCGGDRRGARRIPQAGRGRDAAPVPQESRPLRREAPVPRRGNGRQAVKILVTGAAGFIGFHTASRLLERGDEVVGLDNLNEYYDVTLKQARLARLQEKSGFRFAKIDLADDAPMREFFAREKFERVVHLAAQAGVRYSIEAPHTYTRSNVTGTLNVLEGCRHNGVQHLVYASTSSVYGANTNMPFSVHSIADHPLSLYAATKRANELMAHNYSSLFALPTTGLRFFTVYGPWGRPDMALFMFTRNILEGKPIDVFNHGHHKRDFTYVDDIVEGVVRTTDRIAQPNPDWDSNDPDPATSKAPFRLYNIGNNRPVELMTYIRVIEDYLGRKAQMNMLPLQLGDVPETSANIDGLVADVGYRPATGVEEGVRRFIDWFCGHYGFKR